MCVSTLSAVGGVRSGSHNRMYETKIHGVEIAAIDGLVSSPERR